jgi:multidrug efflux pump subunit AcrA (membrane-fusion protein)
MNGKKRVVMAGIVVAVLATPILVVANSGGGAAHASSSSQPSTSTAKVVRTDLATTQQVSGSIGYDGSYTVANPAGANAQAVTQAQQALTQAEAMLSADQTAASDTAAGNTQSITQAQAAVDASQAGLSADQAKQSADCAGAGGSSGACAQDGQKVTQDQAQLATQQAALGTARLNATRSTHQDQAKVAADKTAVQNAQSALAVVERTAANPGTTFTALAALGQVITQGQQLYAVDGKPVPLFYGGTTMWRAFRLNMSDGADVGQLTADLITLGFGGGLSQSNHFSQATADAIKRWQASLGLDQTGIIRLGEVVFQPGPIRVSNVHPTVGAAATAGPVLDATSTTRVVTVALAVSKEYLVHAGDAVSVLLPDGKTTTTGHIRDVSTVATTPASGSGGSGGSKDPTVNVTITLDHPNETGNLDQAPVNVNITDQAVHGVLAVPINALLALAEGGDSVEVTSGGARRLVAVQTGLFSDTMVEISGPGIAEGMLVEVPSS